MLNPAQAAIKHLDEGSHRFSVKRELKLRVYISLCGVTSAPGRCQNLVEEVFADLSQQCNEMGESVFL